MKRAIVQKIAEQIYDGVTIHLVSSIPREASASFTGTERLVNGMPVTTDGRRPVIGVDDMADFSLPYEREPTHVSAKIEGQGKLGESALRLTFARPEDSMALYGPPISVGLDFGTPEGKEGDPAYSAFSVVLRRGEVPTRVEAKQGDGEWGHLKTRSRLRLPNLSKPDWSKPEPRIYKGNEALFLGGVIYKALILDDRPTQPILDPDPGSG